jgi:parallel beta-helix repeat protein
MKDKVSGLMLTLLMICTLVLTFNINPAKASGTIYIRTDGSIDPPTAPISTIDNIRYYLTDNINDSIVVERDNVVVEGADYVIEGNGTGNGIMLSSRSNVTIKNTMVKNFQFGIYLTYSSNNILSNNIVTNDSQGIYLGHSCHNVLSGNDVTNNTDGITLWEYSCYNVLSGNNATKSECGLGLMIYSCSNLFSANNVTDNDYGIVLGVWSNGNDFSGNNVEANSVYGVQVGVYSSDNRFFHNNLVNNSIQVFTETGNIWDDGYPSGGNYWSDYIGFDLYSGFLQNETGSDRIGDSPYIIDFSNRDDYPLMKPYVSFGHQIIYIRADGSVDPSGAPIIRKGDLYTLTGNILSDADGIVVEKDNIILDGANHLISGDCYGCCGVKLEGRENITIRNMIMDYGGMSSACVYLNSSSNNVILANSLIGAYRYGTGIGLEGSSNNLISGNNILSGVGLWIHNRDPLCSNNLVAGNNITGAPYYAISSFGDFNTFSGNNIRCPYYGIELSGDFNAISANNIHALWGIVLDSPSESNSITGNNIVNDYDYEEGVIEVSGEVGIEVRGNYNRLIGNSIAGNYYGVMLNGCNNSICGNNVRDNVNGIFLADSAYNTISENNITNNHGGIYFSYYSSNNTIYHNNFVENNYHVSFEQAPGYANFWDNGYPSGGNYWSDYAGTDDNGDGIGDTPYTINTNNTDNYPLMSPYKGHDVAVECVEINKTVVAQGTIEKIDVRVVNHGSFRQTFNLTVYANDTIIQTLLVYLAVNSSATIRFYWETSAQPYGNYTITAYAWPVFDETDTSDNTCLGSIVKVTIPGDVDCDFDVDLYDAVMLLVHYGANQGSPEYDPIYDIDGDGSINLYDAVKLLTNYGQKCP